MSIQEVCGQLYLSQFSVFSSSPESVRNQIQGPVDKVTGFSSSCLLTLLNYVYHNSAVEIHGKKKMRKGMK